MGKLEVCCRSDKGSQRASNEDSLLIREMEKDYLLAVADGLGGHAAGEIASRMAVIELEETMKSHKLKGSEKEALAQGFSKANREIYLLSNEHREYRGMGTTLVAALVSSGKVFIANVGDSRAYLIGDGIKQITRDHSLIQEMVDENIVTKEESRVHPQKNILTKSLGIDSKISPDFYMEQLTGNTLLLCSDGLTDALTDDEIREIIFTTPHLEITCDRLIVTANEKGARDNITIILARERHE